MKWMETQKRLWHPIQLLWSSEVLVALFQFYTATHSVMWELHRKYLWCEKVLYEFKDTLLSMEQGRNTIIYSEIQKK